MKEKVKKIVYDEYGDKGIMIDKLCELLKSELVNFATRYEGQNEDPYFIDRMEQEVENHLNPKDFIA